MVTLDSGLSLSFWSQGDIDAPTVVFIPGPTDSWCSYQSVVDTLPADLRVVAVSLHGHGDSSKPTSGYSIEDLSSDVIPLLDALEIPQATLVGHSGSGLVARRVALLAPHRVVGLVMEASPTSLRDDPKLREIRRLGRLGVARPHRPRFREVLRGGHFHRRPTCRAGRGTG